MEHSSDQPLLLGLAVFQNLHKLEHVRSIHMYKQEGGIHTIQQEFMCSEGGALTQMSPPARLARLADDADVKPYMQTMRHKQESENWKCLLDFSTDPSQLAIPLHNNPRNLLPEQTISMPALEILVANALVNSNPLFSEVKRAHKKHKVDWEPPLPSQSQETAEQVDSHTALGSPDSTTQRLQLDIWQQWGSDLELASPRISPTFDVSLLRSNTGGDASMTPYGATLSSGFSPWTHTPSLQSSRMLDTSEEPRLTSDEISRVHTGFVSAILSPALQFESFSGESYSNLMANMLPLDSKHKLRMCFEQAGNGSVENQCGITPPMSSTSISYSSSDDRSFDVETNQIKDLDWGSSTGSRKAKQSLNSHKSNGSRAASGRLMELTLDELSRYFNMPITQASKELKVGLTVLKKRCRVFGIPRWPHRKMKSLNSLILSIKDLVKGDGDNDNAVDRVQNAVEDLEKQKKEMQESPGIQLAERTKRLRQACFKASYRKRRQESLNDNGIDNHHDGLLNNTTSKNDYFYPHCE